MSEPLTVAEALERAADLIEPEGKWTQGTYARDGAGSAAWFIEQAECFCAAAAVNIVSGRNFDSWESYPAVVFLRRFVAPDTVSSFNDKPGRTQAEVVAKLREAAAIARAKGSAS